MGSEQGSGLHRDNCEEATLIEDRMAASGRPTDQWRVLGQISELRVAGPCHQLSKGSRALGSRLRARADDFSRSLDIRVSHPAGRSGRVHARHTHRRPDGPLELISPIRATPDCSARARRFGHDVRCSALAASPAGPTSIVANAINALSRFSRVNSLLRQAFNGNRLID